MKTGIDIHDCRADHWPARNQACCQSAIAASQGSPVDRVRAPLLPESVLQKFPKTFVDPSRGTTTYGRRAIEVLAFRDGYGIGYIIGAITRRLGSLHALAPE